MLAFLGAFLIALSGLRAQSNTEYSFRQQSVADGGGGGTTKGSASTTLSTLNDSSSCWAMYYVGDEDASNGSPELAQDTLV